MQTQTPDDLSPTDGPGANPAPGGVKAPSRPRGRKALTAVYWAVFGLTVLLLVAWALDRSGDPATRGLGQFYALVGLPFLGLGLLLFLLTRRAFPRVLAMIVTGVPLLFIGLLWGFARFDYLIERHRESPGHVFSSADSRGLGEAVERRDLACIRELAAAGADLNAAGRDGKTPLSFALDRKSYDAARLLVERGAPMKEAPGYNGLEAVFANIEAPAEGSPDRAEYLLLVKAMTDRGFSLPAGPGARSP